MKISLVEVAVTLLTGGVPGSAADVSAASKPIITLRVVNEAKVSGRSLRSAKKALAEILGRAGVGLAWINCDPGPTEWMGSNPCQYLPRPSEFWLHIDTRKRPATSEDMLGFTDIGTDTTAGIYYPAVVDAARKFPAPADQILGAAMAHEIGHLVLGVAAHSAVGIMCPHWDRTQFSQITVDQLNFNQNQARLLRETVKAPKIPLAFPSRPCLLERSIKNVVVTTQPAAACSTPRVICSGKKALLPPAWPKSWTAPEPTAAASTTSSTARRRSSSRSLTATSKAFSR